MDNKVIFPSAYHYSEKPSYIFLGGPIVGAPRWHDKAIDLIHRIDPDIYLACPSHIVRRDIMTYAIRGNHSRFNGKLSWDKYYAGLAMEQGGMMLWIPRQERDIPGRRDGTERKYGEDMLALLGELYKQPNAKDASPLIIGIEHDFPELFQNFPDMDGIRVCKSLEETCENAVESLRRKK